MKKKITLLTAAILCVVCIAVGVVASSIIREIKAELRPDFTIKVDGEVKEFRNAQGEVVYPVLYDGTTYLPVRAIGELMGKTVFWYEDDNRIELKNVTVTDADVIVSGEGKEVNKNSDKQKFIGVDEAKNIALEKAGYAASEVKFERTELDEDDGVYHYEIEFLTGGVEYDFDIGAINGAILSWEIDNYDKDDKVDEVFDDDNHKPAANGEFITKDRAKEIVLNRAGLTTSNVIFEDFELDEDDGIYHYEIEFRAGRVEYSADVKATDGTILDWDVDYDD